MTDSNQHSEHFEKLHEALRWQPGEDLTKRYDMREAQRALNAIEDVYGELVEQYQALEEVNDRIGLLNTEMATALHNIDQLMDEILLEWRMEGDTLACCRQVKAIASGESNPASRPSE